MTPLILFTVGWTAGLILAAQFDAPAWSWPALAASLAAAVALAGRLAVTAPLARLRPALAAALALSLGAWRFQAAQPAWGDPAFIGSHNGAGRVLLEGIIADEPDVRDTRVKLRVRVATLASAEAGAAAQPVTGLVLVSAPRFSPERQAAAGAAEWQYGDRVRVAGSLETPPEDEDFSYRDYLARQGVYSEVRRPQLELLGERQGHWFWQTAFDLKGRALAVIARLFPEPHAALLSGILLGVESGIPAEIKAAFSATGTSHIVAISGFNIAILVSLFMALFSRVLRPNAAALVTLLVIAGYTALVGAGASVVRAAIMGGLGVIAQRLGRQAGGLNALAAATLGMTLVNPATLWDVGFQLSAGATLGLILYGDRFQNACEAWLARRLSAPRAKQLANLAGELFLITFAAQVTTLPILAFYFQQVSLISLAANLIILPVQPAVMLLGGLAMLLGLAWPPLGQIAAWLTWPLTAYTLSFVDAFAQVPGGTLALGEVAPAAVLVFYGVLFGLTWILSRPAEQRPAWWAPFARESLPAGGAGALALTALLAWSTALSRPEPPARLRVTVLETGPAPAVLIQTPAGGALLVDGGRSGGALTRGLAAHLPLFQTRLDLLVLAGVGEDAAGGLPDLLERFSIRQALLTTAPANGAAQTAVLQTLTADPRLQRVSAAGQPSFDLGDGVRLSVAADGPRGSALRLEWGTFSLFLPGGADLADLGALRPATALILGARATPATEGLLQALDPAVTVLAAGSPQPALTGALAGRLALRTDERGAVTVATDGRQLWVETAR